MKISQLKPFHHRLAALLAFTLIELLVVISVIVILASILLPVLSAAKHKAQGSQCMNNHRQLSLAWRMYADDSNDVLPFAQFNNAWISGELNFSGSNPSNWDPEVDVKKSVLWPYCGQSVGVFKCPADHSVVKPNTGPLKGTTVSRVRSMAMNIWVGGDGPLGDVLWGPGWRVYRRCSDILDPGPANTFVFLDMREDSISTGGFGVIMTGFPNQPKLLEWGTDWPANYHHRAGGFSFADGHSEMRRWKDSRTMPPLRKVPFPGSTPSPTNVDITWCQERCTRRN
jgi:prepilin-type N-terminal cleavage/methylation domain-containing protein